MVKSELQALMEPELPKRLRKHIDRVVELASTLATQHGADEARATLAAQGHDIVRHWSDEQWLAEAEARGIEILPVDREYPVLLHGPIGAALLQERGWLTDPELVSAVRFHTTGHPAYTPEAWCMFLADKFEPHKLARRPELQRVADAAQIGLLEGALAYLELMDEDHRAKGSGVHPLQTETLAYLRAVVRGHA